MPWSFCSSASGSADEQDGKGDSGAASEYPCEQPTSYLVNIFTDLSFPGTRVPFFTGQLTDQLGDHHRAKLYTNLPHLQQQQRHHIGEAQHDLQPHPQPCLHQMRGLSKFFSKPFLTHDLSRELWSTTFAALLPLTYPSVRATISGSMLAWWSRTRCVLLLIFLESCPFFTGGCRCPDSGQSDNFRGEQNNSLQKGARG